MSNAFSVGYPCRKNCHVNDGLCFNMVTLKDVLKLKENFGKCMEMFREEIVDSSIIAIFEDSELHVRNDELYFSFLIFDEKFICEEV